MRTKKIATFHRQCWKRRIFSAAAYVCVANVKKLLNANLTSPHSPRRRGVSVSAWQWHIRSRKAIPSKGSFFLPWWSLEFTNPKLTSWQLTQDDDDHDVVGFARPLRAPTESRWRSADDMMQVCNHGIRACSATLQRGFETSTNCLNPFPTTFISFSVVDTSIAIDHG